MLEAAQDVPELQAANGIEPSVPEAASGIAQGERGGRELKRFSKEVANSNAPGDVEVANGTEPGTRGGAIGIAVLVVLLLPRRKTSGSLKRSKSQTWKMYVFDDNNVHQDKNSSNNCSL